MTSVDPTRPSVFAAEMRRIILEESKRADVGHIGSALSIADIVAALYCGGMRMEHPDDPGRDRFILSKGHAALALYAALHLRGWIEEAALRTFCADESRLGVHPERPLPGVELSTGSLGQGLSMATGAALAARMRNEARRVFVVISDAECDEGSVWEAAMFAAHHRLANLVVLIDLNGQQALGATDDIIELSGMAERWRAFGWHADEVDGHDHAALLAAMAGGGGGGEDDEPRVVVARTTFGRGVSFMERQLRWHYVSMSDAEFATAMAEVREDG